MREEGYSDEEIKEGLRLLKKKFSSEPTESSDSPSQEVEEVSASVGELPTVGGDTTAEQGDIQVQDFGEIEEPTETVKSLAEDLGISTEQLLTTEVLQDPKAQERNLGRPLPKSEQYVVNGKPVYRDELIDVINNQVDKIQAGAIDIEINDDPELEQRLQRQIEAGDKWGDMLESLGAGLVSFAQSAEGLKDLAATTVEEITGLPASKTMWAIKSRLNAKELGEKAEEIRQKTRAYEGNFLESLMNGQFSNAAAQGINLTLESAPITAMSMMTGGGGSIGSYLLRSATTLTPMMASRELSEAQFSKDPDVQELSQTQKVLRSWLFGGAEALGESVTGRIASKNFNLLKGSMRSVVGKSAQEVGEEGAKKTAKQMALMTARDIAKNMGVDMNSEGASEAITEMAQMLTDDLMGVKNYSFSDYAERMSNAYASGAFMGAVMGVGGAAGTTINAVKKYRQTSLENIERGLNTSVEQGEITENQANEVRFNAEAISQTNPTLSDEAQAKQADLIKERTQLEQFLEGVDKSAAPNQYERIKQINEELTKIAEQDEVQQEGQLQDQENQEEVDEEGRLREEEQTRNEKVTDEEETVLEELPDGRIQEEEGQESPELRTEEKRQEEVAAQEKTEIAESIGRFRRVKPKNIRGLLDVMGGMFGLNKPQAESAAVVGDVMVETMAKRAGISKDEMYQRIAFQKAQKAPDGSLKQEQLTFKSTAKEGLGKIQQKAATTEQWVKQIGEKGGKGTTQELEWIGLQDYLNEWKRDNNAKSVPKEVVEQYINDNQIEIVEVSKKSGTPKLVFDTDVEGRWQAEDPTGTFSGDYTIQWLRNESKFELESADGFISLHNSFEEAVDRANEHISSNQVGEVEGQTKYSQYTLEGGENYREVLLTLPERRQNFTYKVEETEGGWSVSNEITGDWMFPVNMPTKEEAQKRADELNRQGKSRYDTKANYKSQHWDEANILAHLRLNERTLANGERVLFIEEVQSDWAQEGKKKGFASDLFKGNFRAFVEQEKGLRLNEEELLAEFNNNQGELKKEFLERTDRTKTPDMPYKKTDQWVGMAMRRVMQMAAQEGFDRVAWVTGEQSAERYDLSKQISLASAIKNDDGTYNLVLEDTRGNELPEYRAAGKKMTPSEMEDTIGKELAQKLIEGADRNKGREWKNQPTNPEFFTLRGDGLKVGGEGMKTFYNSILPKVAGKEAKRFDKKAKVEVVDFKPELTKDEDAEFTRLANKADKEGIESLTFEEQTRLNELAAKDGETTKLEQGVSKQLSIPITPKMRMNLNGAVPLFQGAQGAMTASDGNYVIYALTDPNVSTPLHELAHIYEHYLTDAERKQIEDWSGHKSGTVEFSEAFARGFEKFLADGKVSNPRLQKIFESFKEWLLEIYNGVTGSEIDLQLNDQMRSIYDQMLAAESRPQEGEQIAEERVDVVQEGDDVSTEGTDGKKIRGGAKSASRINSLTETQREKIISNPKNYYEPQVYQEIKEDLEGMTDDELIENMSNDALGGIKEGDENISVLAAIELINRRLSEDKPIDDIVESMAKKGTSVAQALRQFAELKKSTPLGVLQYVNKVLDEGGVELTPEQQQELTKLVDNYLKAKAKFEQSKREGVGSMEKTVELENQMNEAQRKANAYLAQVTPREMAELVGATIQGNLLTPMSQATNIIANTIQIPTRGAIEIAGSLFELPISLISGKPATLKGTGLPSAGKGGIEGLKKAWNVLVRGNVEGDIAKGEVARSFRPFRAFVEALSGTPIGEALSKVGLGSKKNLLPVSKDTGKPLTKERFKRLYESIFGIAPEIMFRLLSLGDKPFFYSEYRRALSEYAKEKNLKGKEREFFMKFPDPKSDERATQRAKEAVFMEDGTASRLSQKMVSEIKKSVPNALEKSPLPKWLTNALSFAYRTLITMQVPYVKTPTNVLSQTVDLALPVLPLGKAVAYMNKAKNIRNGIPFKELSEDKKADWSMARRKGMINVGKFVVGGMMSAGANYLISNGLVSVLSGDDDEKSRNLKYNSFYPNTINISGLERSMKGQDPTYRMGDRLINFNKLGLFGMVIAIRAQQASDDAQELYKEEGVIPRDALKFVNNTWTAIPAAVRASFEQSFLSGTSALLKAASGGEREVDAWMRNTFKAATAIPLPNTLSATNRATRSYLPDMRADDIETQLMNIVKDRTFQSHDIPTRINFWGEPIKQTPEGADPYIYQLIDVTKSMKASSDGKNELIYNLYMETNQPSVIPAMPQRTIKVNDKNIRLTAGEYNELAEALGKDRSKRVEKLMRKSSFQRDSPEDKVERLSREYRKSARSKEYREAKEKVERSVRLRIKP